MKFMLMWNAPFKILTKYKSVCFLCNCNQYHRPCLSIRVLFSAASVLYQFGFTDIGWLLTRCFISTILYLKIFMFAFKRILSLPFEIWYLIAPGKMFLLLISKQSIISSHPIFRGFCFCYWIALTLQELYIVLSFSY